MIEKIKTLLSRFREQILYLIFGGLTTVIDWGVSFLLYYAIGKNGVLVHAANVAAWAVAVLFAFVTNRIWVFESKKRGFLPVMGELVTFAGARVTTLLLQEGIFFIFLDLMHINAYAVKLIAAVLVIVANYFISKFLVFRNQKSKGDGKQQ